MTFCSTEEYLSVFIYSKLTGSIAILSEYAQMGGKVCSYNFTMDFTKIPKLLRLLLAWSPREASAARDCLHGVKFEAIPNEQASVFSPEVRAMLMFHPSATQSKRLACFEYFGLQDQDSSQQTRRPADLRKMGEVEDTLAGAERWTITLITPSGKCERTFTNMLRLRNYLSWLNMQRVTELVLRKDTTVKQANKIVIKTKYPQALLLLFDQTVNTIILKHTSSCLGLLDIHCAQFPAEADGARPRDRPVGLEARKRCHRLDMRLSTAPGYYTTAGLCDDADAASGHHQQPLYAA